MRDIFIRRLTELALQDRRIFLITADLGFGVLADYAKRLPKQFLNVGVAEQNMTGIATGLAMEGRIVFTYSLGNFPTLRCLEQIRNDACYHDADVKIVTVGGGLSYGALGMSHHATEDVAIMRALPGVKIVAPGDDWETEQATDWIVNTPGVFYLRLDKTSAGISAQPGEEFSLGKARMLRKGRDVTLVSMGGILKSVLEAAERLEQAGIGARVLSMHTVKPLDSNSIVSAAKETQAIISIEEHTVIGGLGGAIAECCMEHGVFPRKFKRIGLQDQYSAVVGSQEYLRKRYMLDADAIVEAAIGLVGVKA